MADSSAPSLVHPAEDAMLAKVTDLELDGGASDSIGTSGEKTEMNDKSSMELSTELEGGEDEEETSEMGGDSEDDSLRALEADEGLLAMIASGQVELEEDDEYDEEDDGDELSRTGSADAEIVEIPFDASIHLPIPSDSVSASSSPKKRIAESELPEDCEDPTLKKAKIEETKSDENFSQSPGGASHATPNFSSAMDTECPNLPILPATESTQVAESTNNSSPLPKPASASRLPRQPAATPSSMVTRTRASHASASGKVPEHSHSVPKYFNRDLVRVIEIPVWQLRETYDTEEDMRTKYQTDTRVGSTHARSVAALADLQRRFMALSEMKATQNGISNGNYDGESSDDEEVGGDEYYAKLHYRKEIAERLRWVDIPGADRFKPEDRHMTVDQFRSSTLWTTYRSNSVGRLLPEEKWAQNIPDRNRNRRPASRSHTPQVKIKTKTLAKGTSAVLIPKGFVLKIKSSTGTSIIGRPAAPPGTRSTLPRSRSSDNSKGMGGSSSSTPKKGGKRNRTPKSTAATPAVPSSPYMYPASPYVSSPYVPRTMAPTAQTTSLPNHFHQSSNNLVHIPIQPPAIPAPPKITKFVVKFGSRTFTPSNSSISSGNTSTTPQLSAPAPTSQTLS